MKHHLTYGTLSRLCLATPLVLFLCCSPEKGTPARPAHAERIVSLSPSLSREIVDLSQRRRLAGVTSYDDYRDAGVALVGTLVQPDLETIVLIKPDLVVYSEEDGLVQNVGRFRDAGIVLYRFRRNRNFNDICANYLDLARIMGRVPEARKKIGEYAASLRRITMRSSPASLRGRRRVAFLLSHNPLIAASTESYIARIIQDAGGACIYSDAGRPYPPVSLESLVIADPDLIISMAGDDSENFFRRLSRDFPGLKAVRNHACHAIASDTIPYYTPADYLKSVERMADIIHADNSSR